MKKVISAKTVNLIYAITLLIAGVLFCVSTSLGEQWISVVIGVGVLLVGLIAVVGDFLKEKCLITRAVIVGSIIVALGIYLIVDRGLVSRILGLIPYILIVAGACVFADSFLLRFVRDRRNTFGFILELFIGIAFIVFGVLMLTVGTFRNALGIIFGILLILYAIYLLVETFAAPRQREKKSAK